jgi:uncharacterized sulfatase
MRRQAFNLFIQKYIAVAIPFLITTIAVRLFEYIIVAQKTIIDYPVIYELMGVFFDVWAVIIYAVILFPIILLLYKINNRIGFFAFHSFNLISITIYISLIITYSERSNPFDHEFFNRTSFEIWSTTKQMITRGIIVFIPFFFYYFIYWLLNRFVFANRIFNNAFLRISAIIALIALLTIGFANPASNQFNNRNAYYLTANKFAYFIADSYQFFIADNNMDAGNLNAKEIQTAISFYQQNQGFNFLSNEYPLLRQNNDPDVLGSFFNLNPATPPNIVIIVTEGLSKDFSGENAYATSFTPFLDSLSNKSLSWDNFLSTSPGTFAAHPAIEGSLPYGKTGFSSINIMPDHLSLIKIAKANGYTTRFLTGSNTDFDNMGGFIRLQGTDMSVLRFSSKYKKMSAGNEGWGMGYPDDALFNQSLELLENEPKTPYLNIYHTATTHVPYLFEQKPIYDRLFDQKLKTLKVDRNVKTILKECKKVMVTYMFADDCFREFFSKYKKRPEYNNTIFIITGDHHIGSFPSTSSIDDYHVPLIIYSPMLKAHKKMYAVNSHNNLAPTLVSMLLNNYPNLPYRPSKVNWLASSLDTNAAFRNQQSMPFMYSNRSIEDYIWKEYMISDKALYRIDANLNMTPYQNDSIKTHITQLLNNFKIINSYVCDNNKIYPAKDLQELGTKDLLFESTDSSVKKIATAISHTSLMKDLVYAKKYTYLMVSVSADIRFAKSASTDYASLLFSLIDSTKNKRNFNFYSNHELVKITKSGEFNSTTWNSVATNDMISLKDVVSTNTPYFNVSLFSIKPIDMEMKNIHIKVWGIQ